MSDLDNEHGQRRVLNVTHKTVVTYTVFPQGFKVTRQRGSNAARILCGGNAGFKEFDDATLNGFIRAHKLGVGLSPEPNPPTHAAA